MPGTVLSGRVISSALGTVLIGLAMGACASGDDLSPKPNDRKVYRGMYSCMETVMDAVAKSERIDVASEDAISFATLATLDGCSQHDVIPKVEGYECDTEGCYDRDGTGYDWTTIAGDWACAELSDQYCQLNE